MSELLEVLIQAGVPHQIKGKNTSAGFLAINCPFCEEERFHCAVNMNEGWYRCFICDAKGQWRSLKTQLHNKHYLVRTPGLFTSGGAFEENVYKDKPQDYMLATRSLEEGCEEYNYLVLERKITKQQLLDFNWVVGISKGEHNFTHYVGVLDNTTLSIRLTIPSKTKPRYLNHYLTPFLGLYDYKKTKPATLYVVEGLFDYVRFDKGSCIAVLGSSFTESHLASIYKQNTNLTNLVFCFDRDHKLGHLESILPTCKVLGVEVNVLDWSKISTDIKDVDEYFVKYGRLPAFEDTSGVF